VTTNDPTPPPEPPGTPTPVAETPAQAVETPAPVIETPVPVIETAAQAVEAPAPVAEPPVPVAETAAQALETPAPAAETPAPVIETPTPAAETPSRNSNGLHAAADPVDERRVELAANLAAVRERIAAACAAAHRDPADVRLLAVTKTFPAVDVALLADLGLADFAENRDADAAAKTVELAALRPGSPVRWTMVGRLQRNKTRSVSEWADEVQSVDSGRLADALQHAVALSLDRAKRSAPMDVLIQASIDGDPDRGGCPLPELFALSDHIAGLDALRLRGVMAVAPLGMPAEQAFDRLASAVARLRTDHPAATCLSLGMSGDLEQAITYGSTCVRVGTALLGGRRLASP
jgi:pyridoxal phosphate enzyme (YggS family)